MFLDETKEHLQNLNNQIMHLEEEPEDEGTINEIFRAAHTLKGMAGTMGFQRMQTLTHDMENVFSEVRSGNLKVQPKIIDVLFSCLDALEEYTKNIQETSDEGTNDNEELIRALNECLKKEAPASQDKKASTPKEKDKKTDEVPSQPAEKWEQVALNDTLKNAIKEARADGEECYGINVKIQEKCLLKAARAFLVVRTVGEKGEIIASNPSMADIEDEKFDWDFTLVVISSASLEEVIKAAGNISEIENVTGGILDLDKAGVFLGKADADQEPKQKESEQTAAEKKEEQPSKAPPAGKHAGGKTIRVDIEKLDELMNLVSELIIAKNSIVSATQESLHAQKGLKDNVEYLERVTSNLHESVMKARMVPIENVTNKFPRMIRDISKKLDKKMELYMTGEDTELDRTVVDELGDPLMHLLRNSADHGLEEESVRISRGKNPVGSIFLDARQVGNNVVIEVRDDGNGIDVEAIKKKALERGVITAEAAETMTDKELIDLLFLPSFSTAKKVTDVSGRGVGLDVVKSKIESLSGEVEVHSTLGEGSTWTIRLPMTLAIIKALMVRVGNEKYAIPLASILSIESIHRGDIRTIQNKEVINLRGDVIPLVRLFDVLEVVGDKVPAEEMTAVVVKKGDRSAALVIDELLGQLEIVIKPLGKYIKQCKYVSGATILGDGEVALILDANACV